MDSQIEQKYNEWIEADRNCIEEYKKGNISLEERAKRLTIAYANFSENMYSVYLKYPDIINLKGVYELKNKTLIILKIIIVFQSRNESGLDNLFKQLNIICSNKHYHDDLIFYEFLYKFERESLDIEPDILNPEKSNFTTINIPRFNSIIDHTPLKSILGTTNYKLGDVLNGLPYSLSICLNNGAKIDCLANNFNDTDIYIDPKYYIDLEHVFRSSWEANIARILNYNNLEWKYENIHLLLNHSSYIPDFTIKDDFLVEVKGFWNTHSLNKVYSYKTKNLEENEDFRRKLYIIDADIYYTLQEIYSKIIPEWEVLHNKNVTQKMLVVGINRPERNKFVQLLNIGSEIFFKRELDNQYDRNAVRVLNDKGNMIGYLTKEWASIYAEKIDMGMTFIAKVKKIELKTLTISVQRSNVDETIIYDFLKLKD